MKRPHTITLPDDIWEFLSCTGNASEAIRQLVEDKMERTKYQDVAEKLEDAGYTQEEIDIITSWWDVSEHYDWLMTASKKDIDEASLAAFGE